MMKNDCYIDESGREARAEWITGSYVVPAENDYAAHFADDTRLQIVTDGLWEAADGPVLRNNLYLGERLDARREAYPYLRRFLVKCESAFDAAHVPRASATTRHLKRPIGRLRRSATSTSS